jgi:2-oxoglutarate/2-oxoacid ferredoxin oxidoreductase subunit beta
VKPGSNASIARLLRAQALPTPFCAGCGHGILLGALLRAIDESPWPLEQYLFVSGIGCAGWIPSPHIAADTLHVTHGRPLAFATGARIANPDLRIVVIGGDGDLASIGGNHLIHAARRNLPMAVICANNETYGMTGGQVTPTTPTGTRTATTAQGNPERPFDLVRLVEAAGATYVARYSVWHTRLLIRSIRRALAHPGFAFIEVLSPCPTQAGRRNGLASPAEMLRALAERCVPRNRALQMRSEELAGKTVIGEFVGGSE